MSSSDLDVVTIGASGKHEATLIFLHGLGDTGHGWSSSLAEIRPPHLKVICPTAETIPVTLNTGFRMPAWFDLFSLDPNGAEDEEGIKRSMSKIEKLVKKESEEAGIPQRNIILGGFSQGGALALLTGLTSKEVRVGGIIGLSTWLPLHRSFDPRNAETPVLQCHGDCDPVVPYKWGQMTSTLLKSKIKKHEFKTFRGMSHSSSDEELADVRKFILDLLQKD